MPDKLKFIQAWFGFENRSLRSSWLWPQLLAYAGKYDSVPIVCKDWEGRGSVLFGKPEGLDKRSGFRLQGNDEIHRVVTFIWLSRKGTFLFSGILTGFFRFVPLG